MTINKVFFCAVFLNVMVGCDFSAKPEGASKVVEKPLDNATIVATGAYMREIAPGQTRAAVYLKLQNNGDSPRTINLISADIAGYAEVHNHIHEDGMMKMREVKHPTIAARSSLDFRPGGYHVMLFDVAKRPAAGSKIELLVEFDKAESLTVPVKIESVN